jgi:undecaprenyl phosphate-alpha-L-ara4N flippase subunit ArnF
MKWRLNKLNFALPDGGLLDKFVSLIKIIFDPFIFSGFISAFIASLFWLAALSKFEISQAYPFMNLAPSIVFLLGVWLLNENFTWGKVIGLILIILGVIVTVKF